MNFNKALLVSITAFAVTFFMGMANADAANCAHKMTISVLDKTSYVTTRISNAKSCRTQIDELARSKCFTTANWSRTAGAICTATGTYVEGLQKYSYKVELTGKLTLVSGWGPEVLYSVTSRSYRLISTTVAQPEPQPETSVERLMRYFRISSIYRR